MENKKNLLFAFTLAEMMVVMLIMSIALAAVAPVMTTKMKTDKSIASSSPWKWSNQGVGPHAYFASSRQPIPMAMIGQDNAANDDNGRLIINTQNDYAHILFKNGGNSLARIFVNGDSVIFNDSEQLGGSETAAFGPGALRNNNGDMNTAVGSRALISNTSGSENVAVGANSLATNTTGTGNVAVGSGTLSLNTSSNNTAIGDGAANRNSSGSQNTAIGSSALFQNRTGSRNTAIGSGACQNVTGSNNTCIGTSTGPQAGYHNELTGSSNNTFIGNGSGTTYLRGNVVIDGNLTVTGSSTHNNGLTVNNRLTTLNNGLSVFNGYTTLYNNLEVFNGRANLYNGLSVYNGGPTTLDVNGRARVTGKLLVYDYSLLHQVAVFTGEGWNSRYRWGTLYMDDDDDDNDYALFDSDGGVQRFVQGMINEFSSDRRLKYVGSENKSGLDKIKQLKVFNYTFKKDPQKTPRVGVIAQDLQKVFPNAVKTGRDGFLKIRTEDILYALVNAVKEIDVKISEILKQVQNDKTEIKQLKQENAELKARLDKLEQKLK